MEIKKKYKILIVDDDQFLLNMYSLKFGKNGFEVVTASGGEEVVTKLREGLNPDALLLDVIMPTMNGIELLKVIKKDNLAANVAIIVLTNENELTKVNQIKELGVDGYIVKASAIPTEIVEYVLNVIEERV